MKRVSCQYTPWNWLPYKGFHTPAAEAGLLGLARTASPATKADKACLLSTPSAFCAWQRVTTLRLVRDEENAPLKEAVGPQASSAAAMSPI